MPVLGPIETLGPLGPMVARPLNPPAPVSTEVELPARPASSLGTIRQGPEVALEVPPELSARAVAPPLP